MTVKIVSDISQGWFENGTKTPITYCYRVIGPEDSPRGKNKIHTYQGVLTDNSIGTSIAEARALQIGFNTAIDLYPQAKQVVCYSDTDAILYGKKGTAVRVKKRIQSLALKRGKLVIFRSAKELDIHYKVCHKRAKGLMKTNRVEQKSPLTTYREEACSREEQYKSPPIGLPNIVPSLPEKKSIPIIARIKKFLNIFRG